MTRSVFLYNVALASLFLHCSENNFIYHRSINIYRIRVKTGKDFLSFLCTSSSCRIPSHTLTCRFNGFTNPVYQQLFQVTLVLNDI